MSSPQPDHEAAKEAAEELLQWESWTADPLMDKWQLVARAYLALSRRVEEAEAWCAAQVVQARDALEQAEACMSMVEPRSDKAEYLRILGVVRAALSEASQNE